MRNETKKIALFGEQEVEQLFTASSVLNIVRCQQCGRLFVKQDCYETTLATRGERQAFICKECVPAVKDFSTAVDTVVGKAKVHGYTFGVEFVTTASSLKGKVEMVHHDYLPVYDSGADIRYKSPVYEGKNALSKNMAFFGKLVSENHLEVGKCCTTPLHIANKYQLDFEALRWIEDWYNSIFSEMLEYIDHNPAKTKEFWGRELSQLKFMDFVEVHDFRLEFTLPVFKTGEQYMRVVRLCESITDTIINNFVQYIGTGKLNHKAGITAGKLVKLVEKAYSKM